MTNGQIYERQIAPDDFERVAPLVRIIKRASPEVAIDDEPTRQICVNVQWVRHLLGALDALSEYWLWLNAEDDASFAPQQMQKLMLQLQTAISCNEANEDEFCMTVSQDIIDQICACVADSTTQIINQQNTIINQQTEAAFKASEDDTIQAIPETLKEEKFSTQSGIDPQCSNDGAYAAAIAVQDAIVAQLGQTFDDLAGATDPLEFIKEALDVFDVSQSTVSSLTEFIDAFAAIDDYTQNAFDSSYTPQLREEYIRDIFEVIACGNCLYDIESIASVYRKRAELSASTDFTQIDLGDLVASLNAVVQGDSSTVADAALFLFLRAMIDGNLIGLRPGAHKFIIKTFLNARDTNDNGWVANGGAPDCPWVYTWNDGDDLATLDSVFNSSTASWSAANGEIRLEQQNAAQSTDVINWQIPSGFSVTRFTIVYELELTNTQFGAIVETELSGKTSSDDNLHNPDGTYDDSIVSSASGTQAGVITFGVKVSGTGERVMKVTKIEIEGRGVNPFS